MFDKICAAFFTVFFSRRKNIEHTTIVRFTQTHYVAQEIDDIWIKAPLFYFSM